ncbi:MAG: RluA family pseudouridine synthase [Oscillospiraceae bacterium]|nr:RluA family pseudouridine synthase [Oscillospiraceae bacterium]
MNSKKSNKKPGYLKNNNNPEKNRYAGKSGGKAHDLSKKRQPKPAAEFTADKEAYLRDFLISRLPGKSFNKIKSLLYHNQVMVNGTVISKYDYPVKPGQKITIQMHGVKDTPGSEFLDIVYEDDEIIVINKPAGLLTIATDKEKEMTAYHFLTEFLRERDGLERIFIVHRLDRETSGLIMFAKNEDIKTKYQENWNKLVSLREYTAIVKGHMPEKKGTVRSWLKETTTHLVYSTNDEKEGKLAITNYEVIKENDEYSMLRVTLDTGRKNQIRVHMKDLGTPIAGDKKYGGGSCSLKRLALHAGKLIVRHPVTGKELIFEAKPEKAFLHFVR